MESGCKNPECVNGYMRIKKSDVGEEIVCCECMSIDADNKLIEALKRMLKMHELMMKKIDHTNACWDAECIQEMNEAPPQARRILGGVK